MDYYKNTIGDMQNEMDYLNYYNVFGYFRDFVKFFLKIFYDTLEYDVLGSNESLYEIDYHKFLLLVYLFIVGENYHNIT